jgi:hypothetical protein
MIDRPALLAALFASAALPAAAQAADEADHPRDSDAATIVVVGQCAIVATLQDLPVERTYSGDDIDAYGAGSVGEAIDDVAQDNGDDEPALPVNGEPVASADDIADYPAEVIERIELLPRGAADRIGVVSPATRTHSTRREGNINLDGPLLSLPAGPISLHAETTLATSRVTGSSPAERKARTPSK